MKKTNTEKIRKKTKEQKKNTEKNKKTNKKKTPKKTNITKKNRKERKHTYKNPRLENLFHFFCGNLCSEFEPKHPKPRLHKKNTQ